MSLDGITRGVVALGLGPRVRARNTHILDSLRNLAISILRHTGNTNIAAALRATARIFTRPHNLIITS